MYVSIFEKNEENTMFTVPLLTPADGTQKWLKILTKDNIFSDQEFQTMRLELKANTIKYGTGQAAKRKYPLLVNKTFILRKYVKEKYPDHFRIWENFKLWPENNSQIIECGCPLTRQILNIKFKSAERNILKKEFRRNKEHQELKTREVYQPQILPEQKNQTLQVQKNHPDNIKMQQIQTQRQDLDDEFFVAYDMENAVEDRLNQSQTLREEAGLNSYNNEVDEVIETIEMTKGDAILASDPADKETEPILKKRKEIMIENIETKIEEVGDDMLNPVKEETEDSAETLSLQETKDEIIERLMAEVAELKTQIRRKDLGSKNFGESRCEPSFQHSKTFCSVLSQKSVRVQTRGLGRHSCFLCCDGAKRKRRSYVVCHKCEIPVCDDHFTAICKDCALS